VPAWQPGEVADEAILDPAIVRTSQVRAMDGIAIEIAPAT